MISCVIPAKDENDEKLKDLIKSIREQDYPQDQIEILVITEGDSESAKAIGIRRAKGDIIGMFCADNMIVEKDLFKRVHSLFNNKLLCDYSGLYPSEYAYIKNDNSLNRYFALIGGNDPVCYYLGKNDRFPHVKSLFKTSDYQPSFGCNGFFYIAEDIKNTDLDHYYPMDNAMEVKGSITSFESSAIWHRTNDNLWTTLLKRYRYARDLYCDRKDRRWKMLDTKEDFFRLSLFVLYSSTFIEPFMVAVRGFRRIKDFAWFWHPTACFTFTIMYGILTIRTLCKRLLSSLRLGAATA